MLQQPNTTCAHCGSPTYQRPGRITSARKSYCSPRCFGAAHTKTAADILALIDTTTSPDGCHFWTGHRQRQGYGKVRFSEKYHMAHRLVWELANGPIPEGMVIAHRCDNPPCCRLSHLFLTTPAGNIADKVAKGRQARGDSHGSRTKPERLLRGDQHPYRLHPERVARGERQPSAKLTADAVRDIRSRCAAGTSTMSALAREYGVSFTAVWNVVVRRNWKHVT